MSEAEINNSNDFDGQRNGENLLFVFRRHIFVARKGLFLFIVITIISFLPFFIWHNNDQNLLLLAILGSLFGLFVLFYHFVLWYFTIYIVTDQRIKQIAQKGFFGKEVVDLQLSKIQNISYNISGIAGSIFKFGTIVIQTLVGDLIIRNVDHPEKVYNKIQSAMNNIASAQGEYEEANK